MPLAGRRGGEDDGALLPCAVPSMAAIARRRTLGAPVGAVGVGAFWPSAQGRGLQGSGPLEHRYRYLRLDARVEKVRALAHVVRERLVVAHDRASWAGWSSKNSRTAFS